MAANKLITSCTGHTMLFIDLVDKAYLRLVGNADRGGGAAGNWNGRGHFFAAAAEAMRRILIEAARRRGRLKRGGGQARVDLNRLAVGNIELADDLIAL